MKNESQSGISRTFCICLFLAVIPGAFAISMDGDITISGGARFNKNLMKASNVKSWSNPLIVSDSGGFASFAPTGSTVTIATPWWFSGTAQSSFFWSSNGFTFDLTSSTITSISRKSLTAEGSGTISGNGFDATGGDWTFTFTKGQGRKHPSGFSFSFTADPPVVTPPTSVPPPVGGPPPPVGGPPPGPAAVPDSGSTLGLLSLALVALFGACRRRSIRLA